MLFYILILLLIPVFILASFIITLMNKGEIETLKNHIGRLENRIARFEEQAMGKSIFSVPEQRLNQDYVTNPENRTSLDIHQRKTPETDTKELTPENPLNTHKKTVVSHFPPPLPTHHTHSTRTHPQHEKPNTPSPQTPFDVLINKATNWVMANWLFLCAGLLLSMSGIFLIIYGVESGVVTPAVRIIGALLLGSGLIYAGERLRLAYGRKADLVPAVLSSAGLIVLYGSMVAAQALYNLIGAQTSFIGLVCISIGALALGGRNRTHLSIFGLIGACIAPFFVIGGNPEPFTLASHYTLILITSLTLSWYLKKPLLGAIGIGMVTLVSPFLIFTAAKQEHLIQISFIFQTFLSFAALYFVLYHPKCPASLFESLFKNTAQKYVQKGKKHAPSSIWLLKSASLLVGLCLILITQAQSYAIFYIQDEIDIFLFIFLAPVAAITLSTTLFKKPDDIVYLISIIPLVALFNNMFLNTNDIKIGLSILFALTALYVHKAHKNIATQYSTPFSYIAALFPVASLLYIQNEIGHTYLVTITSWPYIIMAFAALMVAASAMARTVKTTFIPVGFYAISALALIAHSLTSILNDAPLTIALTALLICAAYIDGKLKLPYIPVALSLGIGGLMSRLILVPGLNWAYDASYFQILITYGNAILALGYIGFSPVPRTRDSVRTTALCALAILIPTTFTLLLQRMVNEASLSYGTQHWELVIITLSIGLSGYSLYPTSTQVGIFNDLRKYTASMLLIIGMISPFLLALAFSPMLNPEEIVLGIPLFNTLLLAYVLPATFILTALFKSQKLKTTLPQDAKTPLIIACVSLIVFWMYSNVRYFWQGPEMHTGIISQGENISYTLLTLAIGISVTFGSMITPNNRQKIYRRVGLAIIGLTVTRALFVDAYSLDGLARVLSFLALGLVLAGMAWVDKTLGKKNHQKQNHIY